MNSEAALSSSSETFCLGIDHESITQHSAHWASLLQKKYPNIVTSGDTYIAYKIMSN